MRARFGKKWCWGIVEYTSHGCLCVQYEDGDVLSPYSVEQLRGAEPVDGHSYLRLHDEANVPSSVVAMFRSKVGCDGSAG